MARAMGGGKLLGKQKRGTREGNLAFEGKLGVLVGGLLDGERARGGLDHRKHELLGLGQVGKLLGDGEGVAHGGVVVEAVGGLDDAGQNLIRSG